jgi:hypothetical protein
MGKTDGRGIRKTRDWKGSGAFGEAAEGVFMRILHRGVHHWEQRFLKSRFRDPSPKAELVRNPPRRKAVGSKSDRHTYEEGNVPWAVALYWPARGPGVM